MKKVLIAAYYSPPYALVGAVRITKFCKYLPQFGWQPWILTVDPDYYQGRILNEIPPEVNKMEIHRIPFYRFPGNVTLVKLFFPILITFFVLRQKKNLDAVLLTGSPFHPFVISIIIKGLLGIPTFLDFRDAWSFNNSFDGRRVEGFWQIFRQHFYEFLERIAIHFASAVIFATKTLQDEYRRLLPSQQKKFWTITNGYDPDDFFSVKPIQMLDKKTIILTGKFNLYTPEVVTGLMQALKSFSFLHFIYIGSEYDIINQSARSSGSDNQVTALPYLPYRELLRRIAGADYGLVTSGMPNILGTKIFDYLALRKPILCFVPKDSEISRNFAEEQSVVICEAPHTPDNIRKGLVSLFEVKEGTQKAIMKQFSRKETTRKLAHILQLASTE